MRLPAAGAASAPALLIALVLLGAPAEAQREPGWEVRIPDRLEVALGETGTLPINIVVGPGLAISKDAPVLIDLRGDGVTFKKARLGRPDAVDPGADAPRFAVAVKAVAAGDHVVKLHLKMWLCGGRACRPLDLWRQAVIAVGAPAPGDAGR